MFKRLRTAWENLFAAMARHAAAHDECATRLQDVCGLSDTAELPVVPIYPPVNGTPKQRLATKRQSTAADSSDRYSDKGVID